MQNVATRYNETYTHYRSKSGNTQIYIYKRRRKTALKRFVENLLADGCYYLKQKALGLAAVGISVASPLLLDGDATISVLMFPLGIFLMVTKEKVCMF